jgi:hypothetical protein
LPLQGRSGDDSIETKDGPQDYLECGSGNDEASVDLSDGVARNREIRSPSEDMTISVSASMM